MLKIGTLQALVRNQVKLNLIHLVEKYTTLEKSGQLKFVQDLCTVKGKLNVKKKVFIAEQVRAIP